MRETNDLYKRLLADPGHVKESRLIIAGEIYDESKIVLSSLVTNEQLFAADKLSIGGAVAREISFSAFLSDSVPKRAKIIHEVRLRLGDAVSEWLQKGEYYISTRRRDRVTGLTEVHGYNSMLTSEQPWKPADTDIFPMPMKEAVEKTAAILGIPLDPRNVFKAGDAYMVDYPVADGAASEEQQVAGLTIRQVWRWIAAAMGGNFIINDLGELRLVLVNDLTATGYLADENGRAITFGENAILVRTAAAAAGSEDLSALGLNMAEASDALPLDPITRVILKISSDTGYVSESDTEGLTLEASCAYGSKTIADDLLAQLQGYVYQPLQAEDALIDPAAELGDPIEVNGVYTILAQKTTTWDALSAADIGAPGEDELEDEYGFTSTPDSEYRYELAQARSLISKTNDHISMEIYGEDGKGGLNGRMNTFTMGLSGISGQIQGYQETLTGYQKQLAEYKVDLDGFSADVERYSAAVEGYDSAVTEYTKEVGSYKLAVDGYSGEVSKYSETVDGYTEQVNSYKGTVEGYERTVAQYSKDVEGYKSEYSTISQTFKGIKLEATNDDGTVSIQLKSGDTALGTPGTIDLTGLVTFSSLGENGTTEIHGSRIKTGTIKANRLKLYGEMEVYEDKTLETIGGYIGYCAGWYDSTEEEENTNVGIGVMVSPNEGQCICTADYAGLAYSNLSMVRADANYLQLNGFEAIYFGLPKLGELLPDGVPRTFRDYAMLDYDSFRCFEKRQIALGTPDDPWSVLYADSCDCCTSDKNKKNNIEDLPDKYVAMFDSLIPKRFKMNNGTSGRYHVGYIAQDVKAAMDMVGIDSTEFGGWVEGDAKDGSKVYMLRYDEFGAIYAAKIKQLEARLEKLEETI